MEGACYSMEGDIIGNTLQQRSGDHACSKSEFKTLRTPVRKQYRLNQQINGVHVTQNMHDQGLIRIDSYQHKINLANSLYFEMYATEKYCIKYISVDVHLDRLTLQ